MTNFLPTATAFAGLLLLAGCATTYEFEADAIADEADPLAGYESYLLVPADPEKEGTLRFREAAEYVEAALSGRGLYPAPDREQADLLVELDYGISEPRTETESRSVSRRGASSIEIVPVYARSKSSGRLVLVGRQTIGMPGAIYRDKELVSRTVYTKYMKLNAFDYDPSAATPKGKEVWSVHVKNENGSDQLRKYLPLLAAASIDLIGTDTGAEQTRVRLKEDAEVIDFVRSASTL
ncbi:MAG: hypothetical protein ACOCVG_01315 [Verrucomicrobiota bacterium]